MVIAMSHVLDIKPRVIAAEVKSPLQHSTDRVKFQSKPHIAGELDLVGETTSEPHYVEVRDGALLLYPGRSPRGPALWRLPLRRLNLQPASSGRPRGFSLSRHGESVPLATFQVGSDVEYERWVKTLAAELMRQTPLDAVRFLDILGITATLSPAQESPMPLRRTHSADSVHFETSPGSSWIASTCSAIQEEETPYSMIPGSTQSLQRQRKISKAPIPLRRRLVVDSARNSENIENVKIVNSNDVQSRLNNSTEFSTADKGTVVHQEKIINTDYVKNSDNSVKPINNSWENAPLPDVVRDLPPCERRSRARNRGDKPRRLRGMSADPLISSLSDETIAKLMARCQQDDQYVPVRDKRLLFETLCRRRFVCSTDNISLPSFEPRSLCGQFRAQSLHDLSDCQSVAVKDMCRYFEQRDPPTYNIIHKKRTLSDSRQLHKLERRQTRSRQNATLNEEALWRLQEQAFRVRIGGVK